MCLYYDSQPHPSQFSERVEEGDHGAVKEENDEELDENELDEILSGLVIRADSDDEGNNGEQKK